MTDPNPWPTFFGTLWQLFKVLWDWLFLDIVGLGAVLP